MSKQTKGMLLNLILSAMIGVCVGVVEIIFPIFNGTIAFIFFRNALIGMVVGSAARYGCHFIVVRNKESMNVLYIYVFLTIGVISSIPALISVWFFEDVFIWQQLVIMLTVAETLGLSLTYASIQYHLRLNQQLQMKKRELSNFR